MPSDLIALFLLAGALSAVTIATVMYTGFPRPETRFTLVVMLLLVYALLLLAPLVFLSHRPGSVEVPSAADSSLGAITEQQIR